jgi:hypothetical protein
MYKRLFYFDKLNWWDILTLVLYFILTVFIYLTDISTRRDWLFGYSFGAHLFLYFFNYKSLRKLNVWLIWMLFGVVHLYFYYEFSNEPALQMFRGFAGHSLLFTWLLLIIFQVLRYISLTYQNQELVALSRSRTDLWDNRRITRIDATCFFAYFLITMILDVALMVPK